MAIATVKVHPIRYPNFVHLVIPKTMGPELPDVPFDVADAFPTDEAAAAFWEESKEGWIKHVAERRAGSATDV